MRLRVLASGSGGNCLALRGGGQLLLVDLGLSCRELVRRMNACGIDPGEVRGVFFTHDHHDHYDALETFHKHYPSVPLYANGNTVDAIAEKTGVQDGWCAFETAETFAVGGLSVTAFSVPHDAADPVGYLFTEGASSFFLGTDMGVMTLPAKEALARATCAVLESNHDPELLERSTRPVSTKQRIRGRSGHLANYQAADAIRELNPPNLRTLLLGHISQQCNAPWLAREAMEKALAELGRTDVALATLGQDEPSALYEF